MFTNKEQLYSFNANFSALRFTKAEFVNYVFIMEQVKVFTGIVLNIQCYFIVFFILVFL